MLGDPSRNELSNTVRLEDLEFGKDYAVNTGGVTQMIDPIIKVGIDEGYFSNVDWVTLSGNCDFEVDTGSYTLHGISLPSDTLGRYTAHKEAIWDDMHGKKAKFTKSGIKAYLDYNNKISSKILELNEKRGYDLVYIHDFQQLPQGKMLGDIAPKLFRWHIPIYADFCNGFMREFLIDFLSDFNMVVVSTKRYERELRKMGVRGNIVHSYPYVDNRDLKRHENHELDEFRERWGIPRDSKIITCVARRTPSKNQSVLIRAMRSIVKEFSEARLILIGNGSFSNSQIGGLGVTKSEKWTKHLVELISSLRLKDNVIMTGYLDRNDIQKAYQISDTVVLPSLNEGFGLTIIEAWLYQKPVVVSKTAGVAERITDWENGVTFDPHKPRELAERILAVLKNRSLADAMGIMGREIASEHTLAEGIKNECSIIQEAIDLWQTERIAESYGDFVEI